MHINEGFKPSNYHSNRVLSDGLMSCIKELLTLDPATRLGARERGDIASVKAHPWFNNVDWVKAEKREYPPLFVPDVSVWLFFVFFCIIIIYYFFFMVDLNF